MRRKNHHGHILISYFTRSLPKATGEHPISELNDHLLSPTIISDGSVFSNSGFVATPLRLDLQASLHQDAISQPAKSNLIRGWRLPFSTA